MHNFFIFKGELWSSEAIYKIHHKILRLLQKNKLTTFFSFSEICKKLCECKSDDVGLCFIVSIHYIVWA